MSRVGRRPWLLGVLVAAGMLVSWDNRQFTSARGQRPDWTAGFAATSRFELSDAVQLDRADSKVLGDLERVKAYLADQQWEEAIETLCQVIDSGEGKLVGVTDRRYVGLRDYGHLQLGRLPAEALEVYRQRVDPAARQWYEEGVAKRDRRLLAKVLDEAFSSSWGDDALLALGEMALESGDYASARWHWERIIPSNPPPEAPRTWPGYPDTELDLAEVRARLVLVSILEGSTERARDELGQLVRLHGDARGRLGGREVNYAEALGGLLAESGTWPRKRRSRGWPTFAGNTLRNKIGPEMIDVGGVAWRIPLREDTAEIADDEAALSFYPVVVGGLEPIAERLPPDPSPRLRGEGRTFWDRQLVLVGNSREIFGARVATGKPAWSGAGVGIFRAQLEGLGDASSGRTGTLGAPRWTMTVRDGRLYARMGSAVTNHPQEAIRNIRPGYLVALDLEAEGRMLWKIVPEEGWALEGSPVADETSVYVAMQRSDIRPQAHVACFDAQTGRRRWRRFVCSAETPAQGVFYQRTHNLLTLDRGTLYYNTNLGAVAALSTEEGRLIWVSLYPRARDGDLVNLAPHWQRDLNPCVVDQGTLLVAPADSPRIFGLEAATGQVLWQSGTEVEDVVHLLGTTDRHLIGSGQKLVWIGLTRGHEGRVEHVWPDGHESLGYGRGVLAGDCVLWPTREKVYVFDQQTAQPKRVIDLVRHGVTGGNLLVAGGQLLIATGTELVAMKRYADGQEKDGAGVLSIARPPLGVSCP
ncbi:MAG: hypothetical protein A2V70_14165 [Planctomycetes bacterium RBG_13_63_9]|nr:MAG: hypothetical protein A2V70_14165 [Planctomycetes bacterium RBG_13_63_9]